MTSQVFTICPFTEKAWWRESRRSSQEAAQSSNGEATTVALLALAGSGGGRWTAVQKLTEFADKLNVVGMEESIERNQNIPRALA